MQNPKNSRPIAPNFPKIYGVLLQKCSPSKNGDAELDTAAVYLLLKSSGLDDKTLGLIWATVNKTIPGRLTATEFCQALALVAIAQETGKICSLGDLENFPIPKLNFETNLENDDDFTDFQSASTSKNENFAQNSKIPSSNSQILYDKYAAFRDLESNLEENDHLSVWSKLCRCSLEILQEAEFLFRSIADDRDMLLQVLAFDRTMKYLQALIEIYALIRRLDASSQNFALKTIELSSLIDQIDEYWLKLIKIFQNKDSILPQKQDFSSYKNLSQNESDSQVHQYCGICLIRVHEKSTNENRWSTTIGRKFLTYAGRSYHSSCANLWLNRVENLLPKLNIPNFLL